MKINPNAAERLEINKLVTSMKQNTQKAYEALQKGDFQKSTLMFNLEARSADKLSEYLSDIHKQYVEKL